MKTTTSGGSTRRSLPTHSENARSQNAADATDCAPDSPTRTLPNEFPEGWYDTHSEVPVLRLQGKGYLVVDEQKQVLNQVGLVHGFTRANDRWTTLELVEGHCFVGTGVAGWHLLKVQTDVIPIRGADWALVVRTLPPIPPCFDKAEAGIAPPRCSRTLLTPIVDTKRLQSLNALFDRAFDPSNCTALAACCEALQRHPASFDLFCTRLSDKSALSCFSHRQAIANSYDELRDECLGRP